MYRWVVLTNLPLGLGDHVRPLVHVGEEVGGADAGTGVETGAQVPVPAGILRS